MIRLTITLTALCGGALLGACAPQAKDQPKADVQDIAEQINGIEARWARGISSKRPEEVEAYYAKDAVVMQPGVPAVQGLEDITAAALDLANDPNYRLEFKSRKIDVSGAGDLAYARGTYSVSFTHPETKKVESSTGNYLTVYRKQLDGTWKVTEDIST